MTTDTKRHALDDQFESGLPDDFDGTITAVKFGYHDRIGNGEKVLAIVTIKTDDPEIGDDGEIEVLYPCGTGWEPGGKPRGSALVHESGRDRKLNRSTGWAQFAYHAFDAGYTGFGGNDLLSADTFIGCDFRWNRLTVDYGGEIGKKERLYPTKFNGKGKGKGTRGDEAGKSAKAADDEKGGKSTGTGGKGTGGKAKYDVSKVDDDTLAALVAAAGDADDYDSFVDAALDIDGVEGNAAAEALVASKAFYDDNK